VTLTGQTRDLNTLEAQYLENSWRVEMPIYQHSLITSEGLAVRSAILATAWLLVKTCLSTDRCQ